MTVSGVLSRLLFVFCAGGGAVFAFRPVAAQGNPGPLITSPAEGAYVSGQVEVRGTTDIPSFGSSELAFAYDPDPTGAWFIVQAASLPVTDGLLATWDTAAITDGDYVLRLRVIRLDGSTSDAFVKVRVRNYTPIPSPSPAVTPTQTAALEIPTPIIIVPSETPTAQPAPPVATPTPLPPNPAGVTSAEIFSGFWRGALLVGVLVLAFGALARLRR